MKVLVTGASGFIGRHCVSLLVAAGCEVHAVSSHALPDSSATLTWHKANLLDSLQVGELFADVRPTHVLHLGWYTEHGKYWTSPANLDWIDASFGMLRHFKAAGGKRIVVAGTCAEYDWASGICSEALTPLRPSSLYGESKKSLQAMLSMASSEQGISTAWGRLFFIYGPHEGHKRLLPSVITSLLKNEPANCTSGEQVRDFLYVEDAARAFVALLNSDYEGPINIGSGIPLSVRDLITKVGVKMNREYLLNFGAIKTQKPEAPLVVADTRRLLALPGYAPEVSLDAGIEKVIEWCQEELDKQSST